MNIQWIIAPLLGCLIGYITNDIAVKMLFHPRKAWYIGKFHIPFTPGLIPAQKERIAKAIGVMVSAHLLDCETLQKTLLSEKTLEKIRLVLCSSLGKLETDERTVEEMLVEMSIPKDKLAEYRTNLKASTVKAILSRISESRIGEYVSSKLIAEAKKTLGSSVASMLANWGIASAVGRIVEDLMMKNAPKIVEEEVESIEVELMTMKMCEIYQRFYSHIPQIVEMTTQIFKQVIETNLDKALAAVDVTGIVVEKIRGFNAEQLEDMVFGVMKRELNAIVYLGAVLGFLMGFVNLLF